MKHVIVLAILAVTIPLTAAEKKETSTPPPATAQQQPDSPLVAAAKRAGRLNKKPAFVITNETLSQMTGGRLTTTSAQQPVSVLPPSLIPAAPYEVQVRQQKAQIREAQDKAAAVQKKLENARLARAEAGSAQYEDGYLDQDPAAAEHSMEQMTGKASEQPTSKPSERPPQN
jgi:hypothetical protein